LPFFFAAAVQVVMGGSTTTATFYSDNACKTQVAVDSQVQVGQTTPTCVASGANSFQATCNAANGQGVWGASYFPGSTTCQATANVITSSNSGANSFGVCTPVPGGILAGSVIMQSCSSAAVNIQPQTFMVFFALLFTIIGAKVFNMA